MKEHTCIKSLLLRSSLLSPRGSLVYTLKYWEPFGFENIQILDPIIVFDLDLSFQR